MSVKPGLYSILIVFEDSSTDGRLVANLREQTNENILDAGVNQIINDLLSVGAVHRPSSTMISSSIFC